MSKATKQILAGICASKKAETHVKPTAEEKKARAKLQAQARQLAKKNAPPQVG